MPTSNAFLFPAIVCLCLSSCAGDPNDPVVKSGHHSKLQLISSQEASKISAFLWSTPFEPPAASPITPAAIVQAFNAQLTKEGKPLRVRLEFTSGTQDRCRHQLAQPILTWQGAALDPDQLRTLLATSSMQDVLTALAQHLGLSTVWYSGTVLLSNHIPNAQPAAEQPQPIPEIINQKS
ncbi:hypothetical protein [Prosthecobacter sp.]|uniref:hypothetical protein n=1 Tax=Prosthecobacter sp. TaxID=1965333 RepID=UPI003784E6CB